MPALWDRDHLDTSAMDHEESGLDEPRSPEDAVDRLGVGVAFLVLCVALVIAAIWVFRSPSFQKCSAMENTAERNACYSELRDKLFEHPAKGP